PPAEDGCPSSLRIRIPRRISVPGKQADRLAENRVFHGDNVHRGISVRVLLHPHGDSVRLVSLYRFDSRRGIVYFECAVYGFSLVSLPSLRKLLHGPGFSPARREHEKPESRY